MKIIVIGTGKVGSLLAEQLAQEGHRIVAIDHNEKKLLEMQNRLDVLCMPGDAVNRTLMIEAGVGTSDLVITATDSDEVNMLCCLMARKLGAKHTLRRSDNRRRDHPHLPDLSGHLPDDHTGKHASDLF